MDNGEPLPSYEGGASAFAKAKADKERDEAQRPRSTTKDAAVAHKAAEVHFKAAHGLIIAFFTWILYVLPLSSVVLHC
jgi:phosphatidylinositol glycan class O